MATNSDSSKKLSEIMQGNLEKTTSLQQKQARLIEKLKSGTSPELQQDLTDLLTGPEPTPELPQKSNQEGAAEAEAWQKHRQQQRGQPAPK